MDVARKMAIACLPNEEFANAEIAPFASGSFHRLFSITPKLTPRRYLMRIALPVDPFFNTESEVATMEYARERSSMPIPRVIGRIVATRFFRDMRAILHARRGPFHTSRELALAETGLLGQRIRHLSPLPEDDYYCGADESLANDRNEVLEIFVQLEHVASSRIYPPETEDGPEDAKVLWHDDLFGMNVLVDPKTYLLTGVVDWESVSIVPARETGQNGAPYFLRGLEVEEPPPLGSVFEEEEEGLTVIRKDWELVKLRRRYCEIVGSLYDTEVVSEPALRLKKDLSELLGDFEDRRESARYWLKHQLDPQDNASNSSSDVTEDDDDDDDDLDA